ncbi:hypothetical protein ACWGMA_20720 [Streptomyces asiaticus]
MLKNLSSTLFCTISRVQTPSDDPGSHRDRLRPAQARRRLHLATRGLDTTTPGGRLVFHVFAALAVISSSPTKQSCDLGGQVKDTGFGLAA